MNITNSDFDVSFSDNSHIFGRPIRISEVDGFMDIPIIKDGKRNFEGLGEWIEKVAFLEDAGIEMHLGYVEED